MMRNRAIGDLAQLSADNLIHEISNGIDAVISNALRLERDAEAIHSTKTNSYDVLLAIAREEAAKALILFDAVRCPRDSDHFQRQLEKFNDHLAKGICAEMCDWEPATFGELKRGIDRELDEFYLDGPNDYDWIFWNRIRSVRDGAMYVDYIECDGEHSWVRPHATADLVPHLTPRVISVAAALKETGCSCPEALSVVRDLWQSITMHDESSRRELRALNYRTLEDTEAKGLLNDRDQNAIGMIVNYLPFPIYDLDLRIRRNRQATLEAIRDAKLCAT